MASFRTTRLGLGVAIVCVAATCAGAEPVQPSCRVLLPTAREFRRLPIAQPRTANEPAPEGAFDIVLDAGAMLQADPQALTAWELAAGNLEALIADPVTVNIHADLAVLPPGVLGSSGSTYFLIPFDTARDAMIADGGSDELDLLSRLPTLDQFSAVVPEGYTVASDVFLTTPNCRALGLKCPASSDGIIRFSTEFTYDYDPSDGITPGRIDFVAIAMHEMIHTLGFASVVDFVDLNLSQGGAPFAVPTTPMDLLRITPGEGPADFTAADRLLAPGDLTPAHACFDGAVDLRFSEGLFFGDNSQASHWRDDALPPHFDFGLMDPSVVPGASRTLSSSDLRVLDLLGWDLASSPASDCNENGLPDGQDVKSGTSADCNNDDVPDECTMADADDDGDVDLLDFAAFVDCATGSGNAIGLGCAVFDTDCDADVDLTDFGTLQRLSTGNSPR